jgi:hypothetical protein
VLQHMLGVARRPTIRQQRLQIGVRQSSEQKVGLSRVRPGLSTCILWIV